MMPLDKTLLILLLALVTGCALGPEYKDIEPKLAPIEPGQGRIYFYRPQLSFLYVGSVLLNGDEVRVPSAGGFVFVDREPGDYEVVVDSVTEETVNFQLAAGEEKYIRITVDAGGYFLYTISPKLQDRETALQEMQELNYVGVSQQDSDSDTVTK